MVYDERLTRRASRTVATDPQTVYAFVSDVARTAEFSDEVVGITWELRASPDAVGVGDVFVATNRRGAATWTSRSTVIEAAPGRRFAFRVGEAGHPTATWTYELAADESGTEITYVVLRGDGPSMIARFLPGDDGERRRLDMLRDGIRRTLDAIADALDGPAAT